MQVPEPSPVAVKNSKATPLIVTAVISLALIHAYDATRAPTKVSKDHDPASNTVTPSVVTPSPSMYDIALNGTIIQTFQIQRAGFGNIAEGTFTIWNRTTFDVKDIKIRCEHHAHSGTVIDENTGTLYETVKAHSKRTFRKFNMGFINSQAASSSCRIVDVTPTV